MEANMKCMTLTVLCCLVIGRYAGALEKPPDSPTYQRSWLRDCLLSDMTEINNQIPGTFADQAFQRAEAIPGVRASRGFKISDNNDVALLADYYYCTRARAEEDLQRFRQQHMGGGQVPGQRPVPGQLPGPEQLSNPAQAGPQDTELNSAQADGDAILDLGEKLARRTDAVKNVAALIYASLPGYFLHQRQMTPLSYFHFDPDQGSWSYVGPVYEAYARRYDAHYDAQHAGRYAIRAGKNVTVAAAPPQLPTWFPRQPACVEWNRMNALRTMQPMRGMNTTPNGVWPVTGSNGSHR
jgi:hypothetical protein